MQQAIKQARRPFNNVLGLVRGKCFASSPSLSFLDLFLYSVFPCHWAFAVLQWQLTVVLQLCFTSLLITLGLTMLVSLNQGSREPFVCSSCSSKCCGELWPEPVLGAYPREEEWWGAVQGRFAGLFHFGRSIFLICKCFLLRSCVAPGTQQKADGLLLRRLAILLYVLLLYSS